jgi:tetratricopeptide (TPR) repeat protein
VISRNSVFTYKGKAVNIQQVAEELGVRYVLEGSVRKSQDRLRITTKLIDAVKGHHLWAERYDRKLKDLFVLQDEITMKIMAALRVKLTAGENFHQWERGTNNLEAYLKLLQARQVLNYTKEGVIGSQQLIKEAIAIDPQYAMAYRNLGVTYVIEHMMVLTKSPEQSLVRAMEMAQKAISLDGTLAEAHALVGRIYLAKGQYEKAIFEGEKACALDPNSDHVLAAFAYSLQHVGRPEEAIEFYEKAIRLDPIPPNWFLFELGNTYRDAGRYEEAIETYKKVLKRLPNNHWVFLNLTITYSISGREEEARAAAAEALKIKPKLSAEYFINLQPYKNLVYKEYLIDILRKAGVP